MREPMQGNVRQDYWELRRFQRIAGGGYEIEAVGHSAAPLVAPILCIAGLRIPLELETSPSPNVGLRSASVTHWSFVARLDSLPTPSQVTRLDLLADNARFLPLYWYLTVDGVPNLPNPENIVRVGGAKATQQSHLSNGRKDYELFLATIRRNGGPGGVQRVLDWGIGCGRVARHFLADSCAEVCGLDIDRFNIDWMNQHLPQVDARLCELDPPTTFDDDQFDTVISFSVLSHLTPANWQAWLGELRRLTKSGAVLSLSFHGDHSAGVHFGGAPNVYKEVMEVGYRDHGGRTELGEGLFEYYRDVFYSDAFATQLFAEHFDVVEIVPCLVSGFQSVAVLRTP